MAKFFTGTGSFDTFMSTRASSSLSYLYGIPHSPVFLLMIRVQLSAAGRVKIVSLSGRHRLSANNYIAAGNEGGHFIRTGPPDFAERYEVSVDLATLHPRAGIVRLDGLAPPDITCCGSGWTGSSLTGGEEGEGDNVSTIKVIRFCMVSP